ncbi:hypothetical protein Salat_1547800 [Sesamum alatum]|uniref:Uncharacterized protein n=1 Tax=Sesamum alatum TaxID=300844 RepID=A0AAE2CMN5_9LAMI|nr:hypothetical protein Salat_1547800 [Sesamum alatum]
MGLIKAPTAVAAFLVILLLAEMALIISPSLSYSQKMDENQSEEALFIPLPVEDKPSELRTWNSWGRSSRGCHKKPGSSGCLPWRKKKPPPPPAPSRVVARPPRPSRPPRRVHWWDQPPPPPA